MVHRVTIRQHYDDVSFRFEKMSETMDFIRGILESESVQATVVIIQPEENAKEAEEGNDIV